MIFSIVDIETTGGSHGNRITEIAVVKTDGTAIVDSYETLINPEVFIPKSITLLTGISNPMVESAPRFEDVADEFLEFISDTVFVAHNVSFDYSIIKNHFEDIGTSFNMKKLCTVRLAKGIIPGYPSYSLGKICNQLQIENHSRHRAMGDAMATTHLFHLLLEQDKADFLTYSLNQLNREATLPPNLKREEYEQLPSKPGVYYLLGEKLEILYVGKAKNVKQRITTHFTEKTRKKSELLRRIHHVSCTETGNELIALLLESHEIKKHFPPYNKAQKFKSQNYHVCFYEGQDHVLRIDVFLKKYANNSIHSFSSMVMAKDFLYQLVEKHELCPKYTGLERTKENCYLGDSCKVCSGDESVSEYNERVTSLLNSNEEKQTYFLVGEGRTTNEKGLVFIKEGDYQGFGFVESDRNFSFDTMLDAINLYSNNNDVKRILNGFLNNPLPKQFQQIMVNESS